MIARIKELANCLQMMSDLTSLLNDRSIIVGLLHLDEVCNARTSSSTRKDKLELTDYVANALQKRNKWLAPLILVTTNCPPEKYGADVSTCVRLLHSLFNIVVVVHSSAKLSEKTS